MDRSAVEAIGELALSAAYHRHLNTDTPAIILRTKEGEAVTSIEKYSKGRARYRGHYTTTSLSSFIATVLATAENQAVGFIEPSEMLAVVYYNLGTAADPGHGDHLASLTLKKTAAYASLLLMAGRKHSMRTLAEWVEDWREFLTPVSDGKPNGDTIAKVIAAIREITVSKAREVTKVERELGASTSAMASVDAQSKHVLPEGFLFTTEPYAGLPPRTFELRMGVVVADSDDINLTLRIQQAESQAEKIAKDFEAVLTDGLGDKVTLSIGAFKL